MQRYWQRNKEKASENNTENSKARFRNFERESRRKLKMRPKQYTNGERNMQRVWQKNKEKAKENMTKNGKAKPRNCEKGAPKASQNRPKVLLEGTKRGIDRAEWRRTDFFRRYPPWRDPLGAHFRVQREPKRRDFGTCWRGQGWQPVFFHFSCYLKDFEEPIWRQKGKRKAHHEDHLCARRVNALT